MSTVLKLNLDEVQSLLGLSSDSILNHIDKGTLAAGKLKNKGEDIYVFEFAEVQDFAKEYLDMTVDLPKKEEEEVAEVVTKKTKSKANSEEENIGKESGITAIISNLQKSYEGALKQMTDYKEQAAFRIGQLEGELSSQKKLLSSGRQEMADKEKLIRKLKIELKKTRVDLEEEKEMLDKMSLWDRIWKKKNQ